MSPMNVSDSPNKLKDSVDILFLLDTLDSLLRWYSDNKFESREG